MIHFVRRLPAKPSMRPMNVVPSNDVVQFALKRLAAVGNQEQPREYALERENEAFHNGDAAMLSNRAVARLDSFPCGPVAEAVAIELSAAIADDMQRCVCDGDSAIGGAAAGSIAAVAELLSIRPTVVAPKCSPARAKDCVIFTLPSEGQVPSAAARHAR